MLNVTTTQLRQVLFHANLVQKRNSDPSIFRLSDNLTYGDFSCECVYYLVVITEFALVVGK